MPDLVSTEVTTLAALREEAGRGALFAILDACDEARVLQQVRALGDRAASLYRGAAADDLAAIAPYLVQVDAALLEWIAGNLWADAWGIFAVASGDLEAIRTHFRKFLLVDAPDGEQWYFRFYDPRVLERFLPTCDAVQLGDFFGSITAFGWTDQESYGVTLARRRLLEQPTIAKPRITFRHA